MTFHGQVRAVPGVQLNIPVTIEGNVDMHAIERLAFAMRGGRQTHVTIWCLCGRPYEFAEYPGHIGSVIWHALRDAGVPELLAVTEPE